MLLTFIMGTIIYGNINLHCNTFLPGKSASDLVTESIEQRSRPVIQREPESIQGSPGLKDSSNAERLYQDYTNNCVQWSKKKTGISESIGYGGRDAQTYYEVPEVNAILIEKSIYHVGVVESITDTGVWIEESNYIKNWIDRRFVPYSDVIAYIY